jgi:hypothetical protein
MFHVEQHRRRPNRFATRELRLPEVASRGVPPLSVPRSATSPVASPHGASISAVAARVVACTLSPVDLPASYGGPASADRDGRAFEATQVVWRASIPRWRPPGERQRSEVGRRNRHRLAIGASCYPARRRASARCAHCLLADARIPDSDGPLVHTLVITGGIRWSGPCRPPRSRAVGERATCGEPAPSPNALTYNERREPHHGSRPGWFWHVSGSIGVSCCRRLAGAMFHVEHPSVVFGA